MANTRRVLDLNTGRWVWMTTYERNGRLVTQRLPAHLFKDGLTPRRMEVLADFAEDAGRAFGTQQTAALPPAAERVRAGFARRRAGRKIDEYESELVTSD